MKLPSLSGRADAGAISLAALAVYMLIAFSLIGLGFPTAGRYMTVALLLAGPVLGLGFTIKIYRERGRGTQHESLRMILLVTISLAMAATGISTLSSM